MVQLDVTAVNVALQWIGTSLGGGVAGLQWGRERLHGRVCQLHSLSGCTAVDRLGAKRRVHRRELAQLLLEHGESTAYELK